MDLIPFPHHPHEAFYRNNFAHKKFLTEILDHVLPPELVHTLDKDSIVIENASFLDKYQFEYFSDLSASIHLCGHNTYVYLLMEHKENNDPMGMLQILRYMKVKWTQEIASSKEKNCNLTSIIPILFHNSRNKNSPTRFPELFEKKVPDSLKTYQPEFLAALYNLTTTSDEKLNPSN